MYTIDKFRIYDLYNYGNVSNDGEERKLFWLISLRYNGVQYPFWISHKDIVVWQKAINENRYYNDGHTKFFKCTQMQIILCFFVYEKGLVTNITRSTKGWKTLNQTIWEH